MYEEDENLKRVTRRLNSVGKQVFVERFELFEACARGSLSRAQCVEQLVSLGVSNESGAGIRCGNAALIFRDNDEYESLEIVANSSRLNRATLALASKILSERANRPR